MEGDKKKEQHQSKTSRMKDPPGKIRDSWGKSIIALRIQLTTQDALLLASIQLRKTLEFLLLSLAIQILIEPTFLDLERDSNSPSFIGSRWNSNRLRHLNSAWTISKLKAPSKTLRPLSVWLCILAKVHSVPKAYRRSAKPGTEADLTSQRSQLRSIKRRRSEAFLVLNDLTSVSLGAGGNSSMYRTTRSS